MDQQGKRGAPQARNLELAIALLVVGGALPAVGVSLWFLWQQGGPPEVKWTLSIVILVVWIASGSAARQMATRSLNVIANLLAALREGDYSIRGLSARSGSSMAMVMREVNDLGSTLQRQRTEAVESTVLLTHVMEEIAVAVFAFDPMHQLLLVNKAGERLFGKSQADLLGTPATGMGMDEYLTGEPRRLIDRAIGGRKGRYEVRRAAFYRDGRPHHLIVIADLSQALREEEQAAWQRIVRVLSHEINNSLTPIKSIAHSLRRIVDRAATGFERSDEVSQGLSLIEERSGALGRFLRAYAQLARLPKPQPKPLSVTELMMRIVELEKRLPVRVTSSPEIRLVADSDQLEQALINLVRNAVDASLETNGGVAVRWSVQGDWAEIAIDDDGKGLPDTSNLFVPFFTTKPNGSGIGLALSRQIAEAHGGTITLENRVGAIGCRAQLRLPMKT
ncbi:MAG: PAS domain S-box protein [Acidobacteria bacterium]|jgi:PAS domain S-box-containing protein|nr:PAS domain S-box protein [Acidobacteriota bacterium]